MSAQDPGEPSDDIDGLSADMGNAHEGRDHPVHHLEATHIPDAHWDPDHWGEATDRQINGGRMDGFAASYTATLAHRHAARGRKLATDPVVRPAEQRGVNDLQAGIISAATHMRANGLPQGQP